MNIDFITSRVQSTLMIDTTHEIVKEMNELGIPHTEGSIVMFGIIMALFAVNGTSTKSHIMENFIKLIAVALVGILSSQLSKLFPDMHSTDQLIAYTLLTTTIIACIKSLPVSMNSFTLLPILKFSFVYATASRLEQSLLKNPNTILIACICMIVAIVKQDELNQWTPPVVIRALLSIFRQLFLNLSIIVFITADGNNSIQDIVYCLGLVLLITFITSLTNNDTWRVYALWRVGDIVTRSIQTSLQIDSSATAIAMFACYALVSVLQSRLFSNDNLFVALLRLITSTTMTHMLIDMTNSLPTFDLIALRFFIVLVFF